MATDPHSTQLVGDAAPTSFSAVLRNLFSEKLRLVARRRECETMLAFLEKDADASAAERRETYLAEVAENKQVSSRLDRAIVAAESLSNARSRRAWLLAMQEVLGNLLAIEQFAIYSVGESTLHRVAYSGIAAPPEALRCAFEAQCGLLSGHHSMSDACGQSPCGVGCFPLKNGERVSAILMVCSLLPQKHELTADDQFVLRVVESVAEPPLDGESEKSTG